MRLLAGSFRVLAGLRDGVFPPERTVQLRCAGIALAALAILAPAAAQAEAAKTIRAQPPRSAQPAVMQIQKPPAVITSVTPTGCVKIGTRVTIAGSNFGAPKPAGSSLAVKVGAGDPTAFTEISWNSTEIVFTVPEAAGLVAGSPFWLGILSGEAFGPKIELRLCAAELLQLQKPQANVVVEQPVAPAPKPAATKTPAKNMTKKKIVPGRIKGARIPYHPGTGSQSGDSAGAPELLSTTPADCVSAGGLLTVDGVNLGTTKQSAGLALGIQLDDGSFSEIAETYWSPTIVRFIVPPAALLTGWFTLGIIYQSEFYPQLYVISCDYATGEGDYWYDDGSWYDSGSYDEGATEVPVEPVAPAPKGARMLRPGGVDITIAPPPAQETAVPEPPPAAGKRVVGVKLLAMKSLGKRGLYKVNKECDLFDAALPLLQEGRLGLPGEGARPRGRVLQLGGALESGAKTARRVGGLRRGQRPGGRRGGHRAAVRACRGRRRGGHQLRETEMPLTGDAGERGGDHAEEMVRAVHRCRGGAPGRALLPGPGPRGRVAGRVSPRPRESRSTRGRRCGSSCRPTSMPRRWNGWRWSWTRWT